MTKTFKFCPLCSGKLSKKNHDHDELVRLTCEKCGFIVFQNPTPTVLAIIERKISKGEELLLVKRAIEPYKGYWDLPGGFVEKGQNLETALKQEIKEETGLLVYGLKYFDSFVSNYQVKHLIEPICCCVFKALVKPGKLKPGSDVSKAKWFNKKKLPQMVPHKDVKQIIKKILLDK